MTTPSGSPLSLGSALEPLGGESTEIVGKRSTETVEGEISMGDDDLGGSGCEGSDLALGED